MSFDEMFDNCIKPRSIARHWFFHNLGFGPKTPEYDQLTPHQRATYMEAVSYFVQECHREAMTVKDHSHLPDWIEDWSENDVNWRKKYKPIKG